MESVMKCIICGNKEIYSAVTGECKSCYYKAYAIRKYTEMRSCKICNSEFRTPKKSILVLCNKCKTFEKNEIRKCVNCKAEFICRKNSKKKSCNKSCSAIERSNRIESKKKFTKNNPNAGGKIWKGRKLSESHIESLCQAKQKLWENPTEKMLESMKENFEKMRGENNPFYKGIPALLREKFGDESGVEAWKKSLSIANAGEKNPMYGRPTPMSGRGISGWYKSWYFRSTLELSYMINVIERFDLRWSSAEVADLKIHYEYNGKKTYVADFLIGKYLVECKPRRLRKTAQNIAKFNAAEIFCKHHGLIFKVTSPRKFSVAQMLEMHSAGIIVIENSKLAKLQINTFELDVKK